MPDRDKVAVGDLVYLCFWEGCFVHFHGYVKKDEDGKLYVDTQPDMRGYLKDAHEIRKAVISKGNLCFAYYFDVTNVDDDTRIKGCYLVCVPMNADGSISWKDHPPHAMIPEPERIEKEDAKLLGRIAEQLGCELY